MNAPKDTRPFDLAAAKAGAPYACRNGMEATVFIWDRRGVEVHSIAGVLGASDEPTSWTKSGNYSDGNESGWDLVMLPLGEIDGKPVFTGDEFEVNCLAHPDEWKRCKAEPTWAGTWNDDGKWFRWPAPAKVYPETQMTGKELWNVYFKNDGNSEGSYVAVANAALRHAIDSGQLPTKEAYDQLRADLLEAEQRNAARDMAIAEAVRDEIQKWMEHPTWAHAIGGSLAQGMRGFDLAAIIAKVPVSA